MCSGFGVKIKIFWASHECDALKLTFLLESLIFNTDRAKISSRPVGRKEAEAWKTKQP